MNMMSLESELRGLLKKRVRKEEVKSLMMRLYGQYFEKEFLDGEEEKSPYIEINSFYIYMQFEIETKEVEVRGTRTNPEYVSEKVDYFWSALSRITNGNIERKNIQYKKKEDSYIVQMYFSIRYEVEALQ